MLWWFKAPLLQVCAQTNLWRPGVLSLSLSSLLEDPSLSVVHHCGLLTSPLTVGEIRRKHSFCACLSLEWKHTEAEAEAEEGGVNKWAQVPHAEHMWAGTHSSRWTRERVSWGIIRKGVYAFIIQRGKCSQVQRQWTNLGSSVTAGDTARVCSLKKVSSHKCSWESWLKSQKGIPRPGGMKQRWGLLRKAFSIDLSTGVGA